MNFSKSQILGVVRHVLTFAGGILVARGIIDEATFAEISGGLVSLLGVFWSISSKNQTPTEG